MKNKPNKSRRISASKTYAGRLLKAIEARDVILDELKRENILLAKLASKNPEFCNLMAVIEAERIRDRILKHL